MGLWFKGINCPCPYLNGWCDVSLCKGYLNFQSPWILSRVFLRTTILFLQPHYIAHHHPVVFWLLLVLAVAPWLLILLPWSLLVFTVAPLVLLLFPRFFSVSLVHIPYSPSSCYTIKKQFHVRSAVFLQASLVLLPRVLIKRFIILKFYFSKMNSSFINIFLRSFLKII